MQNRRYFYPALLVSLTLLMVVSGLYATSILRHNLYPITIDDDLYYLAREKTVSNGFNNIGNPYYFEHRLAKAPATIVPDIIASIPMKFGSAPDPPAFVPM